MRSKTQADLARDRWVSMRASEVACTRTGALEVATLRGKVSTCTEGRQSDSGQVVGTAPTTGTGSPADVAPQGREVLLIMQSKDDGDYDSRQLRGTPVGIPTQPIQDPFRDT